MIKEIHEHEGAWYFWNEIWEDKIGPFETEEDCKQEYYRYYGDLFGEGDE